MSDTYTSRTVEYDADTMRAMLDTVVKLTKLRQNECNGLCIENFAPLLFANLLHALDGSYREPEK